MFERKIIEHFILYIVIYVQRPYNRIIILHTRYDIPARWIINFKKKKSKCMTVSY